MKARWKRRKKSKESQLSRLAPSYCFLHQFQQLQQLQQLHSFSSFSFQMIWPLKQSTSSLPFLVQVTLFRIFTSTLIQLIARLFIYPSCIKFFLNFCAVFSLLSVKIWPSYNLSPVIDSSIKFSLIYDVWSNPLFTISPISLAFSTNFIVFVSSFNLIYSKLLLMLRFTYSPLYSPKHNLFSTENY